MFSSSISAAELAVKLNLPQDKMLPEDKEATLLDIKTVQSEAEKREFSIGLLHFGALDSCAVKVPRQTSAWFWH